MRYLVVLVGALVVALLFVLLREEPREVSPPKPSERPGLRSPGDRERSTGGGTEVTLAIAALEERVAALESELRSLITHRSAPTQAEPPTTKDEFEQQYGGFVRSIVGEVAEEQERQKEKAAVRERVSERVGYYTRSLDLEVEQSERLFDLLLQVKQEALDLEERFAPHGEEPHRDSPEHRQWLQAWQDIIARWSPALGAAIGFSPESGLIERAILSMASPGLKPRLP